MSSQPTPAASIATARFRIAATVWPWRSCAASEKSCARPSCPAKWTSFVPRATATWLKPGAGCSSEGLISSLGTSASFDCHRSELVVGDEAALAGGELLHAREQLALPLVGDLETQLDALDPDRVDPALLAEHDSPVGADQRGRVRLDRRRVVELAGDRARLAR